MKIAMDILCRVFSRALDIIEEEQTGISDFHSMRTAALCAVMGKKLGFDYDALSAFVTCALFHDNALTEHPLEIDVESHCIKGQSNVSWLPFKKNIDGIILYHHERGDGSGPFGKKEGEYPLEAALLAAADMVDATYHLQNVLPNKLAAIRDEVSSRVNDFSSRSSVDILLEVLDSEVLESLRNENISATLDKSLPRWELGISESAVTGIAEFTAHIIDFKSKFTRKHSSQIANRSWLMAEYYGYNHEEKAALYIAAALHDIGKIGTPTGILEKPGQLNDDEFRVIKNHALLTHDWLSCIPDFELPRDWAANHHEKLDGSGYPFGKRKDELDFNSRLVACIDIYQAVSEARPYHEERSHAETMPFLYKMADKGQIDSEITKELDRVMEAYSLKDIPSPRIDSQ